VTVSIDSVQVAVQTEEILYWLRALIRKVQELGFRIVLLVYVYVYATITHVSLMLKSLLHRIPYGISYC